MRAHTRNESRRPVATTAWLVTLAAVVAIGAAIAAGRANAAAHKPPHPAKETKLKKPKLDHGVLTVKGSDADDRIALRLQAGRPDILEIDAGDDGSADFTFDRADVASIAVDARGGEDPSASTRATGSSPTPSRRRSRAARGTTR